MKIPKHILPNIVFAQFAGTSLWFAGNAILPQIQSDWHLPSHALAQITTAVMLGFILGTLAFALLSIADRFKASSIFMLCATLGALANMSLVWLPPSLWSLLIARLFTGFCLAGIYPVGMKIAADWFSGKLGNALGFLVGALVLGTAFPHLLNAYSDTFSWQAVLIGTSLLAFLGGIMMLLLVGEGPYQVRGAVFDPKSAFSVFKKKDFRNAAFGYFGHMWELYTFWAFVPFALSFYNTYQHTDINVALWSFLIIASGTIGCIVAGKISLHKGSANVAFGFLVLSGICCLISPLLYEQAEWLFLAVLVIWGFAVVGDSAQFSTVNAQTCPQELKGTALTIAVSIGFFITIPSIQLMSYLTQNFAPKWALFTLVIGPIFGLSFGRKLLIRRRD